MSGLQLLAPHGFLLFDPLGGLHLFLLQTGFAFFFEQVDVMGLFFVQDELAAVVLKLVKAGCTIKILNMIANKQAAAFMWF